MDTLPKADEVVIPFEKFRDYVLNLEKDVNKAIAFETALGYNIRKGRGTWLSYMIKLS
jgi:hypothetical protein